MEIIELQEHLDPDMYEEPLKYDNNPDGLSYKIDRGMDDLLAVSVLPFNHYAYLEDLSKQTSGRVRVLEAGCGQAKALYDLKKGILFKGLDIRFSDLQVIDEDVKEMFFSLIGKKLTGLGTKIHTTGITLSNEHALFIQGYKEPFRPDRIIVGSLLNYARTTTDRYDFIFDHLGVAVRYPKMAIPSFAKLLDVNATSLFSLYAGRTSIEEIQKLTIANGLEILDCRRPKLGNQLTWAMRVKKLG